MHSRLSSFKPAAAPYCHCLVGDLGSDLDVYCEFLIGAPIEMDPSGSNQPGLDINRLLYTFDIITINDTLIR